MPRSSQRTRWLMLAVLVAGLLALLPGAHTLTARESAVPHRDPGVGGDLEQTNRRLYLPMIASSSSPPIPPQTSNRSMTLRPVPLTQVQRGTTLSVEFRYQNDGPADVASDNISLFYPSNIMGYQWVTLASGDRYVTHDGQRVVVQVNNVRAGERRTGRINFLVERLALPGSAINLFGEYSCQPEVTCRTATSGVNVVINDNEQTGGGTFTMSVSPDRGPPGTAHVFQGSRFIPGEEYRTWLNTPTGVRPLTISGRADNGGNIRFTFGSGGLGAGFYSMVAHGTSSNVENVAPFIVQVNGQPGVLAAAGAGFAGGADLTLPGAPFVLPQAVVLAGNGIISGTVQDASAASLADVVIEARNAEGALVKVARSQADGSYSLTGLDDGSYSLLAQPRAAGRTDLAFVGPLMVNGVVVTGTTPTVRNLVLPAAGGLSGQVTADGSPVAGVRVVASNADGTAVGGDLTDRNGTYTITNLLPVSYTLSFDRREAPRAAAYVGGTAQATVIANVVTPVPPFVLTRSARNGQISGTVRDAASDAGAGIGDVLVIFTRVEAGQPTAGSLVTIVNSEADGSYASGPLPAGNYRVHFLTLFSDNAETQGYIGAQAPDPVTVTAGAETAFNIDLTRGAAIGGVVSGEGTGPLAEVLVVAFDADGLPRALDVTAADGSYSLGGLVAGNYTLRYFTSVSPNPAAESYANATYDANPATPALDPLPVAGGAQLTSINISLPRGSRIAGAVSADDTGGPLEGVVVIFVEQPLGGEATLAGLDLTDADGRYSSPTLVSGRYKIFYTTLLASDPATRLYVDEFFNNAATLATATAVPIERALITRTINVSLALGGSLGGRVVAEDSGVGLGGVLVVARAGDVLVGGTVSDNAGFYSLEGLPAGAVTLEFITRTSPNAEVRAYNGTTSDPLTVEQGGHLNVAPTVLELAN